MTSPIARDRFTARIASRHHPAARAWLVRGRARLPVEVVQPAHQLLDFDLVGVVTGRKQARRSVGSPPNSQEVLVHRNRLVEEDGRSGVRVHPRRGRILREEELGTVRSDLPSASHAALDLVGLVLLALGLPGARRSREHRELLFECISCATLDFAGRIRGLLGQVLQVRNGTIPLLARDELLCVSAELRRKRLRNVTLSARQVFLGNFAIRHSTMRESKHD